MRWHDATRIRELTIELTKVPSISGTDQEREMDNTISLCAERWERTRCIKKRLFQRSGVISKRA